MAFRFLGADVAQAVHDRQLAEHGGLAGVKDHNLLEAAIARPLNKHGYGVDDVCDLARRMRSGSREIIRSPTATSGRPGSWRACSYG